MEGLGWAVVEGVLWNVTLSRGRETESKVVELHGNTLHNLSLPSIKSKWKSSKDSALGERSCEGLWGERGRKAILPSSFTFPFHGPCDPSNQWLNNVSICGWWASWNLPFCDWLESWLGFIVTLCWVLSLDEAGVENRAISKTCTCEWVESLFTCNQIEQQLDVAWFAGTMTQHKASRMFQSERRQRRNEAD